MATIKQEYEILKANLNNPHIPENLKPKMRETMALLENKMGKTQKQKKETDKKPLVKKPFEKIERTTQVRRDYFKTKDGLGVGLFTTLDGTVILDERIGEEVNENSYGHTIGDAINFGSLRAKFGWKKTDDDSYDCDEIIKKEKLKTAKKKQTEAARAKKRESTLQKERVERVGDKIVSSIEYRLEKGEKVTEKEIDQLIDSLEQQIKELQKLKLKLDKKIL